MSVWQRSKTVGACWYDDHFELRLILQRQSGKKRRLILETEYQQQQINWSLCVASFIIFGKINKITLMITITILTSTLSTEKETI